MQDDQKEMISDVLGADDNSTSVSESTVQNEQNEATPTRSLSKQSPKFSMPSLTNQAGEIGNLARLKEKEKLLEEGTPESEIRTLIMEQSTNKFALSSERIDEIGLALIQNYASIELAAESLGLSPFKLRKFIAIHDELQQYFEIAHEGIKGITDKLIITELMRGNPKVVKMVFNKMYSGRAKGAYNPSEIGVRSYQDPLAKKLALETEKDRSKGQIEVTFNFIEKEAKSIDVPVLEEHIIDVEESDDE